MVFEADETPIAFFGANELNIDQIFTSQVDISELIAGVYIIHFEYKGNIVSKRFVKM